MPLTLTERMARIRKTDTKPELIVRRLAHAIGYRYRLHRQDLPGSPHLVFPARRKVVFVHGCFWHRHDCRDGHKIPHGKPEYWKPKLDRNAARDKRHLAELGKRGWQTHIVWECELGRITHVRDGLIAFLGEPGSRAGERAARAS